MWSFYMKCRDKLMDSLLFQKMEIRRVYFWMPRNEFALYCLRGPRFDLSRILATYDNKKQRRRNLGKENGHRQLSPPPCSFNVLMLIFRIAANFSRRTKSLVPTTSNFNGTLGILGLFSSLVIGKFHIPKPG